MIKLHILNREDLPYRVFLLNHDAIAPYINISERFTLSKTEKWFSNLYANSSRKDFVFISDTNKVGMGGLTNISLRNKHCELYMYMDPNFQGRGLGFYACRRLCEYAFNDLCLEKVFLFTFSDNKRANKLYEKIGFKLEGVLRKHTYKDAKLHDRNFYGILRNEFN